MEKRLDDILHKIYEINKSGGLEPEDLLSYQEKEIYNLLSSEDLRKQYFNLLHIEEKYSKKETSLDKISKILNVFYENKKLIFLLYLTVLFLWLLFNTPLHQLFFLHKCFPPSFFMWDEFPYKIFGFFTSVFTTMLAITISIEQTRSKRFNSVKRKYQFLLELDNFLQLKTLRYGYENELKKTNEIINALTDFLKFLKERENDSSINEQT